MPKDRGLGGKITELSSPIRPPKQNYKNFYSWRDFPLVFRGRTRKGILVIFPHFSGISAPEGSRPLSGKTTRNTRHRIVTTVVFLLRPPMFTTTLRTLLREKRCLRNQGKSHSQRGGRDSKLPCDCRFATRGTFTIVCSNSSAAAGSFEKGTAHFGGGFGVHQLSPPCDFGGDPSDK